MNCVPRGGWTAAVFLAVLEAALGADPPSTLVLPSGAPGKALTCTVDCGARAPVTALDFAPDGKTLAAAGYGEVLFWDVVNGRLARRAGEGELSGQVQALAFQPSGKLLAAGDGRPGHACAVRLLDVATGKVAASFPEPKDVVTSLAFSPDGTLLAAGSADAAVRVWNVDGRTLLATLVEAAAGINAVAFSADGKMLAAGGADRSVRVYGTADWKPVSTQRVPEAVRAVTYGPDALLVAAVGDNSERALHFWTADPRQNRVVDLAPEAPQAMAWIGKTGRLAVACTDAVLRIHDTVKRSNVAVPTGHTDWVTCVAGSADGNRVATGGPDGLVKLFAGDGKPLATFAHLAPGKDRWLILSAPGYFESSEPAAVRWSPPVAEPLAGKLHNADLLRDALAGKPVPPPEGK